MAQKGDSSSVSEANNPLTPKITVNFQDQAVPQLYDLGQGSIAFLLRGVLPHKLGGTSQIFRFTMPIPVTSPDNNSRTVTGVGDLNIFDIFPFALKKARMEGGIGQQLTFPTASETVTGTGKWQAGVALLGIAPRKWSFDIEQSHYVIPIGAGAGKVWILKSGTTVNLFAEPQFSVAHDGVGQPKFQVFVGLNPQFPIGKNN